MNLEWLGRIPLFLLAALLMPKLFLPCLCSHCEI
jgi:hypothetical protein